MRRFRGIGSASRLCLALASALLAGVAQAGIGQVTSVEGRVTASNGADGIMTVGKGDSIEEGSIISTPPSGYLWSRMFGEADLVLRPNSRVATLSGEYAFRLLKGGARISNAPQQEMHPTSIRVVTPVGTITVPPGAEMVMRYCRDDCFDVYPAQSDGLYLGVVSGEVSVENYSGTHQVRADDKTVVYGSESSPVRLKLSVALEQDPIPSVKP